ncbi:hypothetical protein HJG60_010267 [Phyllostomus discolor]|uniref:Uncharacterized protein n=1 Tax=Phyllostomus discolor TaxID=89673 RepID=A0A834EK69_9CHIR|nr:hypothetical protein HJG60_010267 [Phyllostomus discolor]
MSFPVSPFFFFSRSGRSCYGRGGALGVHRGWAPQSLDCDVICGGGAGAGTGGNNGGSSVLLGSDPSLGSWVARSALVHNRCLTGSASRTCSDFVPNFPRPPHTADPRQPRTCPALRLPRSSSPTSLEVRVYFDFLAVRLPFRKILCQF